MTKEPRGVPNGHHNLSNARTDVAEANELGCIDRGGGGALQLHLYGGVWPQDWKINPFAD